MGKRFTAIKNFHSDALQSEYVAGLSYEAQDQDKKLLELIPRWIKEGKVTESEPGAIMSGKE